jgi:hypothetical protein
MRNALFLIVLLLSMRISTCVLAQITPKEESTITYRLIGFSFPPEKDTKSYKIQIAWGCYYNEDSFKKNIILKLPATGTKVIGEVPYFGRQYTWRVVSNAGKVSGELHHFNVIMNPSVDTGVTRLRIIKNAEKYKDAFVFLDNSRALYDMKGNAVWCMPDIGITITENTQVRDMKLTSHGTITFLLSEAGNAQAYEMDYDGHILWKAPNDGKVSKDSTEHYHHELTRLANGHYMVLGTEYAMTKFPMQLENGRGDSVIKMKLPFGTIIEYDEKGNVVWNWNSSKYFASTDIYYFRDQSRGRPEPDIHDNAFFFDEKNQVIYVSYKRISRVLKIKYPEGEVVGSYGEKFEPFKMPQGNGWFCEQHSCSVSSDGYLCLFNNNECNPGRPPTVIMLEEDPGGQNELRKVWEYELGKEMRNSNSIESGLQPRLATVGGNIIELADKSFFVSTCNTYGNLFIVDRSKNELWNAIPEQWDQRIGKWLVLPQYRASIITKRELLDALIWHDEKSRNRKDIFE